MSRPQTITDSQIDTAARGVFIKHGANAPVALVAKRLGVSAAALFQRVGNKDAILRRALRPQMAAALEMLSAAPSHGDTERHLLNVLQSLSSVHKKAMPIILTRHEARLGNVREVAEGGAAAPPVYLRRALAQWLQRFASLECDHSSVVADILLNAVEARCFNRYLGDASFVDGDDETYFQTLVRHVVVLKPKRKQAR